MHVLEEALAAQVVVERKDRAGHYDFTHALIRQTLYGELSTPRRVLLHRQIGDALERLYGDGVDAHPHPARLPGALRRHTQSNGLACRCGLSLLLEEAGPGSWRRRNSREPEFRLWVWQGL